MNRARTLHSASVMRQHVIVMRGRFAAWKSPAVLDLDIMVEVHVNMKE